MLGIVPHFWLGVGMGLLGLIDRPPAPGTPSSLEMAWMVALSAIFGAWVRHALSQAGASSLRHRAWNTWGVNMVACFLVGLLAGQGAHRISSLQRSLDLALAVGFLGSLSTYSTLMAQLLLTWEKRARGLTLQLAAASLWGGLVACRIGLVLGRDHL